MADNYEQPPPSTSSQPSKSTAASSLPTITVAPRTSFETLFNGGVGPGMVVSPGPLTLVSSFFAENDECRSFSQLLAGAMSSPVARPNFPTLEDWSYGSGEEDSTDFRLKQNGPASLTNVQSAMFSVPPGLSPAGLIDSPRLFSPSQGPFGMSHQQALAQVTAQAIQGQSNLHIQNEYSTSSSVGPATLRQLLPFSTNTTAHQQVTSSMLDSIVTLEESPKASQPDQKSQSTSYTMDKPNNDGYNWRKYGQKQVKGSEFPRSYYKCTHPTCPVKKKVERSLYGQVTEIIYKGQHNHQPPQSKNDTKDTGNPNGNLNIQGNSELTSHGHSGQFNKSKEGINDYSMSRKYQESNQATSEQISVKNDSEEVGDARGEEKEPDTKRQCAEVRYSERASSHRTVAEPRIIVQTTSEVDLLNDGYRWRKYGQKVVKGNPYPRSYYKCTTSGCNVRKHVERAASDPKAVITTYEGKHNHDVPAARNSSHDIANNSAANQRLQNDEGTGNHGLINTMNLGNNGQQSGGHLLLKDEQIT